MKLVHNEHDKPKRAPINSAQNPSENFDQNTYSDDASAVPGDQGLSAGACIGIGIGVGAVLGAMLHNLAVGVAFGVALGLLLGSFVQYRRDKHNR